MRWRLLALAALLAGCASPAPGPVVTAPLGSGPSDVTPTAGAEASQEWWNATIVAGGAYELRLPVPTVWRAHPFYYASPLDPPMLWLVSPRVEGNATAGLVTDSLLQRLVVRGEGDARVSLAVVRMAAPGETADTFLRARWGPDASDVRPTRLLVDAQGEPMVSVEYVARSERCERRAAFASDDAPAAGRLALAGADGAWCT